MAGLLPDRNPALAGVSPRSVARRPTRGAACITPYLPPNHVSPWGSKSLTCVTTPAGLTRLWAGSPGGRGNDGETNNASSAAGRGGRCRTECLVGSTAVSCQFLRSLPAPRYWYRPLGWQPAIGFNHAATVPTDRHRMHGQCKSNGANLPSVIVLATLRLFFGSPRDTVGRDSPRLVPVSCAVGDVHAYAAGPADHVESGLGQENQGAEDTDIDKQLAPKAGSTTVLQMTNVPLAN